MWRFLQLKSAANAMGEINKQKTGSTAVAIIAIDSTMKARIVIKLTSEPVGAPTSSCYDIPDAHERAYFRIQPPYHV
jgi:hypothetical protein